MKKLILLLVLAAGMIACRGERGLQGPPGEGTSRFIQDFTVLSADWDIATFPEPDIPSYFYYEDRWSELTNTVYRYGSVHVYLYQTIDGTEVLTPLPCTVYRSDNGAHIAENYTFDYRVGYLTFIVRDSDFITSNPPTMKFRIVFEW